MNSKANIQQKFTRILFYKSPKRENSSGLVPVYCRITTNGKRSEISTGIFIKPEQFDNGEIIATTPTLNNYQKRLEIIKADLIEVETNLKIKNQPITSEKIKHIYLNGFKESYGIFSYVADEWLAKQGQLVDIDFQYDGYIKRKRVIERFNKFLESCNKTQIYLCEIKEAVINDYCLYCYSKLNLSKTYVRRDLMFIKSIINYAVINDYTSKNYISHYKIKKSRQHGEIKSLSLEQLKVLSEAKFNSIALQYTKDCFLFQCYTGLAFVDLYKFSMQHITKDNTGKLWCIIHRQKTSSKSTIPLTMEALSIIEKYSDLNHKVDSNIKNPGLLPVYCNQTYNRLLKEIALICNIDTNLMTSHTARKTFAMVVLNNSNVSIETVSKMLGHTRINVTQEYYAYVDKNKISNEMQNFSFTNLLKN